MIRLSKEVAKRLILHKDANLIRGTISRYYSGIGSIVMFHRVVKREDLRPSNVARSLEISSKYLEEILKYFSESGYRALSLDEFYRVMVGELKIEGRFVVYTFDDGYIDNYTVAYPIFKRLGIPFGIYVTTGFPDKTADIWWYALSDLVEKSSEIAFSYGGRDYVYKTNSRKAKDDAISKILKMVVDAGKQKEALIETIFSKSGIDRKTYVDEMALEWKHIEEMSSEGLVTIGTHTLTHPNLKQLEISEAEREILESRKRIEESICSESSHFAFPFGYKEAAGEREFQLAKRLGFKTAVTTREGNIFLEHRSHLNCLPRISPDPFSYNEFSFPEYYANGTVPMIKNKRRRIVVY